MQRFRDGSSEEQPSLQTLFCDDEEKSWLAARMELIFGRKYVPTVPRPSTSFLPCSFVLGVRKGPNPITLETLAGQIPENFVLVAVRVLPAPMSNSDRSAAQASGSSQAMPSQI